MANSLIPERGVYAIQCVDGRAYVGSAVDIKRRWCFHRSLLRHGRHRNRALQDAWTELGEEAFAFAIIEIVNDGDLIEAEQRAMDRLGAVVSGFNVAPVAGSSLGMVHTAEARANMAKSQKGRYFSPTHRARISAAKSGESHHRAKVTESDVREIRRRFEAGDRSGAIGLAYGLSGQAVSLIGRRKRWAHVA